MQGKPRDRDRRNPPQSNSADHEKTAASAPELGTLPEAAKGGIVTMEASGRDSANLNETLCCPRCKGTPIGSGGLAGGACPNCGFVVQISDSGVGYDYAQLLRAEFPHRYRLYRTLCNNGFVSYHELAEGSLSLPDRPDVAEFGEFLATSVSVPARVLDVGCGPLPAPGYLLPLKSSGIQLLGLDIYATSFEGFRITGCAEFLPLRDATLDAVIFATSLDHVCDLDATLGEVARVLRSGGHCCIWMSDRRPYWREFLFCRPTFIGVLRRFLLSLPKQVLLNLRQHRRLFYGVCHFFSHGRYWEYENGSTFYCPPGAVDPFHSCFESPAEVVALASPHGLVRTAFERGRNGVYLRLTRTRASS